MHRLNYHLEVFNIKFLHVLIIAILVKCGGFNIFDKSRVLVNTSLGSILGYVENGIEHFLGVPFAEPPLNRYRFRHPRRKRAWYPSTYRAFNFSPECLQSALYSDNDNPTEEDCLYLNIWSPANRMELLPVLIWIYGGAFLHGGASRPYYYGHRLAAKGVVVVSFNYRVGALGFLVSSSDGVFGNSGLYDQKMAIEWVNDHISNFGGDPSRITLFGESAGAMSVALHMLNNPHNSSKCLFRSIILQSNPLGYK
jgi:para-nitrobenzyl esterase